MVDDALYYVPLISLAVVAGLFILALINFSARKSFQIRTEQQMNILKMEVIQRVYERILEMRIRLENTEEFIGLAQESSLFAEQFEAAGTPAQYFTIMASFDIFEYVFGSVNLTAHFLGVNYGSYNTILKYELTNQTCFEKLDYCKRAICINHSSWIINRGKCRCEPNKSSNVIGRSVLGRRGTEVAQLGL
jgi:hypothetical protein